jgi:hypothetical protein
MKNNICIYYIMNSVYPNQGQQMNPLLANQVQQNQCSATMQSGFRQLIINSIATRNKVGALGNIRGYGKDPTTRGTEMKCVFQEFANMTPTQLGAMGMEQVLGNFGESLVNMGQSLGNMRMGIKNPFRGGVTRGRKSRVKKQRKTRRR